MKPGKRIMCFALLTLFTPGFLPGAQKSTRIADSGTTVIKGDFPRGKVVVKILTVNLEEGCSKVCPTSRPYTEGPVPERRVGVINGMSIEVNGHPVEIPPDVYATLPDPAVASVRPEKRGFVLKIWAGGPAATDAYFALIYFDTKAVNELKLFGIMDPVHPYEVAHFYIVTIGS